MNTKTDNLGTKVDQNIVLLFIFISGFLIFYPSNNVHQSYQDQKKEFENNLKTTNTKTERNSAILATIKTLKMQKFDSRAKQERAKSGRRDFMNGPRSSFSPHF